MNILAGEAYVATPLFSTGEVGFGWADIILAVIILVFVIVNIIKGFLPQIAGFVGLVGSILLATTFSGVLLEFLLNNTTWQGGITNWLAEVLNLDPNVTEAEQLGLPTFIIEAIKSYKGISTETNLVTLACETIARYILLAGSFVAIFIVARLLFLILKVVLKGLVEKTPVGIIDKILALLLGLIKALIVLNILSIIVNFLTFDFMEVVRQELAISYIWSFTSNINIIAIIISLMPWFVELFGSFGASTSLIALGLII